MHSISQLGIKKNSENGMSLIAALIVVTLFTSLILVMATQHWANTNMNALSAAQARAFYLTESGIDYSIRNSMVTSVWDWSGNINLNGETIDIVSTEVGDDSVTIVSTGQSANLTARQNSLLIRRQDLRDNSVYVSGSLIGFLWGDPNDFDFNQATMPAMNIDSMRTVSQAQGFYHAGNYTINTDENPTSFWSDPTDWSKDASIVFVEGNLTVKGSNTVIYGIYVVFGTIKFQSNGDIRGVIFMANSTSKHIHATGHVSRTIYGGMVGNGKIMSTPPTFNLTCYIDDDYITKFYTYALDLSTVVQLERLSWQPVY
jgi:hypothetical protein